MYMKSSVGRSIAMLAGIGVLLLGLAPSAAAGVNDPSTETAARESTTLYYDQDGRDRTSLKTRTDDRYEPLATGGPRTKPRQVTANGKTSSSTSEAKASDDFWIYYADVELFADDDNDGYFYGLDVLFDADTVFEIADVYAVLYLSYEGGPWNEYAVTETFSIHGAISDDEYVVVTELRSGYPTGSYDLLIELYDTYDGAFVAEMGPEHNSGLGLLPLEDLNRDDPRRDHHNGHHGGGPMDWSFALLLGAAAAAGRMRRPGRAAGPKHRSRPAQAGLLAEAAVTG
jgi:hypothetical protein